MSSLIQPEQIWVLGTVVLTIAAFGLWAETTNWGLKISGAVLTILTALFLSNIGFIPLKSPVYDAIWTYALPFSIPLLLYQADIKRIIREAGKTLLGFLFGAIGTIVGAIGGFFIFPLGEHAAKLAASFTAAYIGGSLNFVATARAINLDSQTLVAAGIATANLVVTIYLITLFLLPNLKPLAKWLYNADEACSEEIKENIPITNIHADATSIMYALTISASICSVGYMIEKIVGWPGMAILSITLITVLLATIFPVFFNKLQIGGQLGIVLLQIFFAALGASASIYAIIEFGPVLIYFASFVLIIHFIFILIGAKLMSLNLYEMLIGTNACSAGAPTAAAMAVSMRRPELVLPGILCGTLGYAIGNFIGILVNNILS